MYPIQGTSWRLQVSYLSGSSTHLEPKGQVWKPFKDIYYFWETQLTKWKKVKVLVIQLYLTLCDPMDCSQPGSSVHGIFQARI